MMKVQVVPVVPTHPERCSSGDPASGPRLSDDQGVAHARRRVLIAEDDRNTREMYAWCLRAAGWLVVEAADGQEAVHAASAFVPDVIVMDLGMPVLGGMDAIVHLKTNARTRAIPIVICTGLDPASLEGGAKPVRCDGFIAKPCRPDDLVELLEQLSNDSL